MKIFLVSLFTVSWHQQKVLLVLTTATEEEIEVEDVYTDDEEEEEPSVSSGSERGSGINSLESETVLKGKFFLYYHSDTEKFVWLYFWSDSSFFLLSLW